MTAANLLRAYFLLGTSMSTLHALPDFILLYSHTSTIMPIVQMKKSEA